MRVGGAAKLVCKKQAHCRFGQIDPAAGEEILTQIQKPLIHNHF